MERTSIAMMRKLGLMVTITLINMSTVVLIAQSEHSLLREGDQRYQEQQYNLAEEAYRKANEKDPSIKSSYNLGNTLFNQQRFEEAIQKYQDAVNKAESEEAKAAAYYNMGNAFLSSQKFGESIEAYKNSLQLNPKDLEVKNNLLIAKRMLQQQKQQQQQQQQKQDQQQQQQEQDQNQKSDDEQEQDQDQQNDQQSENQQDPNQQDQKNKQQEPKQDIDKKDAERLLKVVENEEKKVQENMRRSTGNKPKSKKDW